jgi:hypothetical protein
MAVQVYGVKFTCDACGVDGCIADQYPAAAIRYNQIPVPEGWVNLGLFGLVFTDAYGSAVNHLCRVCGGLSIGDLTARLKVRAEREQKVRM